MPRLQEFLTTHAIDINELARIKHRLFVVGRFNRREVSAEVPPEVYLFTNRPKSELSDRYLALFNKAYGLSYESFVKALQPAIAEHVEAGKIPKVVQYMPSQEGSEEGSVVIDMWNFFFWRAIANSDQEAFKGDDMGGAAREILREGESDPGRGIYKLIRKNLNLLCSFQPRTAQLAEAFSAMLASTGKLNGLPAYASGGALPGGFLEKLIDFVYSPDLGTDFSLDGVDLNDAVWDEVRKSEKAQKSLVRVVNTFRNALVGASDQHVEMKAHGGASLYQKAKDLLAKREGLVQEFEHARKSYNALNQIVRSKVLLSMVLEWVFKSHYDLDAVKSIENDEEGQDLMVSRLILGEVKNPGVAEPIKRATTAERDRFKKSLAESFESLLLAVIAVGVDQRNRLDALPKDVQAIAQAILQDEGRVDILKRMAGAGGDPRPFIASQKTVLLDVLIPVLYQAPTVSLFDLRILFRRGVQTGYLTAVTLDDKYQGIVRQLAQEFLPTFTGNIDDKTRAIKNSAAMQRDLLKVYIERIANKDLAERIIEAQEEIKSAMTVLENTVVKPGETRGASHIAPIYDDEIATARRSEPGSRVDKAVGNIAVETATDLLRETEKVLETVSAGKTGSAAMTQSALSSTTAASASRGGTGNAAAESSGASSEASGVAASPVAADNKPTDAVRQEVSAMVQAFLKDRPKHQTKDLLEAVRDKAENDTDLVDKARNSLRVYHRILSVIYRRYRENQEKQSFVGHVERMTLANLMLSNQEALGLGKASSNLYAMLLDVVENMDAKDPDPKAFIRDYSLTRYFDNDVLEKKSGEKSGVTELRETLLAQAHESLQNTVSFISELRGIKYLMDIVSKDTRAEIVVVNATADEFMNWIVQDNLSGGHAAGQRLHSGFITSAERPTACPGLVYLTDSAFAGGGGKGAWLESLKRLPLVDGQQRLVLPPLCLSTGVQDDLNAWAAEGVNLARIAEPDGPAQEAVPAPVVVVGPSPYLNRPGDTFGTYLPAGYVFAAHFLCQPDQRVNNRMVKATDNGRFRVIGGGVGAIRGSLDRLLWGGDASDRYAFSADFYLYILLTVLATARNNIRPHVKQPTAEEFFQFFTGHRNAGIQKDLWATSSELDRALIGRAHQFALEQNVSKVPLSSVVHITGAGELQIRDIQWFNQALEKADLPRSVTNPAAGVSNS